MLKRRHGVVRTVTNLSERVIMKRRKTMIIYAGKDYNDVSRKAANIMSAQIIMKPDAVLGLATGSTPVGMYKQLIEWYKKVIWTSPKLLL